MSRAIASRRPANAMPTISATTYSPPITNTTVAIPLNHPGNCPANRREHAFVEIAPHPMVPTEQHHHDERQDQHGHIDRAARPRIVGRRGEEHVPRSHVVRILRRFHDPAVTSILHPRRPSLADQRTLSRHSDMRSRSPTIGRRADPPVRAHRGLLSSCRMVVVIGIPLRSASVTGVRSAISASRSRWSSGRSAGSVIVRSIAPLPASSTL